MVAINALRVALFDPGGQNERSKSIKIIHRRCCFQQTFSIISIIGDGKVSALLDRDLLGEILSGGIRGI
jgi:hypothetical protein